MDEYNYKQTLQYSGYCNASPKKNLFTYPKMSTILNNSKINIMEYPINILLYFDFNGIEVNFNNLILRDEYDLDILDDDNIKIYDSIKRKILNIINEGKKWYISSSFLCNFVMTFFHKEMNRIMSLNDVTYKSQYPKIKFFNSKEINLKDYKNINLSKKVENYKNYYVRYFPINSLNDWDILRSIYPSNIADFPFNKEKIQDYPYYSLVPLKL